MEAASTARGSSHLMLTASVPSYGDTSDGQLVEALVSESAWGQMGKLKAALFVKISGL